MRLRSTLIPLLALAATASAQSLHNQIASIAATSQGQVAVACALPGVPLDCAFHAHAHPPMQSVFKFPLAVSVLHQVELGKLSLDQKVRFLPSDRYPGTYSPLQDAHPDANIDVPLRELLTLSVSRSDNTATDILLRLIGGPATVQAYLDSLGFPAIHVRDSERSMHDDNARQYRNDADPTEMVALLRLFADHSPLRPDLTRFLLDTMSATQTGPHRIPGLLPRGTVAAHKTGTSDVKDGLAAATNDVGLITLPDGRRLALAVFVTDSRADEATREHVIAAIARAIYDAAIRTL